MADEPGLYARLLGQRLLQAREAAGLTQREAAERISRNAVTIGRIEGGAKVPDRLQLEILTAFYTVSDEQRGRLDHVRELALQPTWWAHLGDRPAATAGLLAMEEESSGIRQVDLYVVPGLLQTRAHARTVNAAVDVAARAEDVDTGVELRMARQARVWGRERPPDAEYLLDESVLHRMAGSPQVRRDQLRRLLEPPPSATVRLVPYDAGPHPSIGSYAIFDVDLDTASTITGVHTDGPTAGRGRIEDDEDEVALFTGAFARTRELALAPHESAQRIEETIAGLGAGRDR